MPDAIEEFFGGYTCPWCGQSSNASERSCPGCGAPTDVRAIAGSAGWYHLPGIRDMAKIQFGDSYCQIEGKYVPVVDMNLAKGAGVYFSHYLLLWKDPQVKLRLVKMPDFAQVLRLMMRAEGPGHIAFSKDEPGELCALTLEPGQAVDVPLGSFMLATTNVQYEWFSTDVWYTTKNWAGGLSELFYPMGQFIARFQAKDEPGLAILHGCGNIFVRNLAGEEDSILINPGALVFKDASVLMSLHIEEPEGNIIKTPLFGNKVWNQRNIWLRLSGPGSVAIQSAFGLTEDNGYTITNNSTASSKSW